MAHESIVTLSEDNFESEVVNADVPVLVDFWAPWCGPCQMLGPVLDQIAAEKGTTAKVAKVNTDEQQALAAKFGVQSLPTLMIFKGGEVKDTLIGLQPKEALVAKLDAAT